MTDTPESGQDQSTSSGPPRAGRKGAAGLHRVRRRLVVVGVAAVVLGLVLAAWPKQRRPIPDPPSPDLTGADEEAAELIRQGRDRVLRERTSSTAWGLLGEVLLAHEFNREANRCFQQAEALDPREAAWPYLQGLNLAPHDPGAAIPCLQRAVERCDQGPVEPRLLLAEVLLEAGRLDESRTFLEQVVASEPGNRRARLGLGRLALLREDWRSALENLQACRDDVHSRKRARASSAEAWHHLGETERAQADQRLATTLPEDRPWPDPWHDKVLRLRQGLRSRFQAVLYLQQQGRMAEAVQLLRETLARYPQSAEGWMRLGEVWRAVKNWDQAQACYRQVIRIDPDLAQAWFQLGCVQAQVPDREAVASFRQAVRCKPAFAEAHYNLGVCLKGQGDQAAAAEAFREALRCRPDFDLARTALRELPAEAEKAWEKKK
jgi:tetratricopeptide (TPR) repeat protein